jgi:tetratricopeptide (TPR) repeat protein
MLLYQPVEHYGFLNYDDPSYVTANIPVQNGLAWRSVRWAMTSTEAANWHPLAWLSHMLDVQLFGLNPAGHHWTSVLLHALNCVLLFVVLWKLTARMGRSFAVAALFGVHPLAVQSVAWISERKNLLCELFFLLGILAYWRYCQRPSGRRYLWMVVAAALALMAKPMAVTFPLVLLLLDAWPLERFEASRARISQLLAEKIPLFVLSAGSAWITYYVQKLSGAAKLSLDLPLRLRLENAINSYALYLRQIFWPTRLAIFYPHPIASLPLRQVALAVLLVAGITAIVLHYRKSGFLATGWLWYLGTLVPVIGVVQVGAQAHADRYMYLPIIGLLIVVVWLVAAVLQKLEVPAAASGMLLAIVIVTLGIDAREQMNYWRDSATLFARALEVAPVNNYIAHANLADALMSAGECEQAKPHFEIVLARFPNAAFVRTDAANCLRQEGNSAAALQQAQMALPDAGPQLRAKIHLLMGFTLLENSDLAGAEEQYRSATGDDPEAFDAHLALGSVLEREGNTKEAATEFSRSLEIFPTTQGYFGLGHTLEQQSKYPQAIVAYQQALKLEPQFLEARQRLAALQNGKTK